MKRSWIVFSLALSAILFVGAQTDPFLQGTSTCEKGMLARVYCNRSKYGS